MTPADNTVSTTMPAELEYEENDKLKWLIFTVFVVATPVLLAINAEVAAPIVFFGVLLFCTIFLFSDHRANLCAHAQKLWKHQDKIRSIHLQLEAKPGQHGSQYYFVLGEELPQFDTRFFVVSMTSSDGMGFLVDSTTVDKIVDIDTADLLEVENNKEVIMISVGGHRFWCKPWTYLYDFSEQMQYFEEHNSSKT